MEIQIMKNNLGVQNFYIGHPFSKSTYTNSVLLRTPISIWESDFDGIYNGKEIEVSPFDYFYDSETVQTEFRVIRGTKELFIGDNEKIMEMENDKDVYYRLKSKAMVKIANPDYMDFDVYTRRILNDPLKNIFDVNSVTPEQAKKYVEYAGKYDDDKKHSDRLILKSYFISCENGVLILTDDFVDYNLTLKIDVDAGVVNVKLQMGPNTSKYLHYYTEV